MALIELDNVALTFQVRTYGRITLKEYVLKGGFRRRRSEIMQVEALEDIDLRLGEGERVGIIGHNGLEKARCCGYLAGVYQPRPGGG